MVREREMEAWFGSVRMAAPLDTRKGKARLPQGTVVFYAALPPEPQPAAVCGQVFESIAMPEVRPKGECRQREEL